MPPSTARPIAIHRFFMRTSVSLAAAFAWILIFVLFTSVEGDRGIALTRTAYLFALAQIVTALSIPFAARMLRNGVNRTLILGVLLSSAAWSVLAFALEGCAPQAAAAPLVMFAILFGAYRAWYWVPFPLESGVVSATARTIIDTAIALSPALAGVVFLAPGGSATYLFIAASAIALVSLLPLSSLQETYERFSWGYGDCYSALFDPRFRKVALNAYCEGAQSAALLFFWPIVVFMLSEQDYAITGLVCTASLLAVAIVRSLTLFRGAPTLSHTLTVIMWIGRLTVMNIWGAVAIDVFARLGTAQAADAAHDHRADFAHYLDEISVVKEIAASCGKLTLALIAAVISLHSFPVAIEISLVLAALAALGEMLASRNSN